MRKGWYGESYRHSLAAMRISTKKAAGRSAYASLSVASVNRAPSGNFIVDSLKDTADYMFRPNEVSDKNPLSSSISESWKDWFGKVNRERLVGGVADNVPDDYFDDDELTEGIGTEMEHTKDPDVAKEIAKDHIYETGKLDEGKVKSMYYPKLKKYVEGEESPKSLKTSSTSNNGKGLSVGEI